MIEKSAKISAENDEEGEISCDKGPMIKSHDGVFEYLMEPP